MATVRMIVRDSTTGDPVSGRDVEVRTVVGDALLDTLTTDSNGLVTYTADGSPGPLVFVTDSGTTVRKTSGQNLDQVGTYYLADVPRLLSLLGDGVVAGYTDRDTAANDLALSPGTGRRINVASGAAIIDGTLQRFTGTTAVDIAENTSGATRYDLLVLGYTRFGETREGKADLVAVTGTSTTTGPALTKSNATRQLALGVIRVVDGASSFVTGDITDLRYSPAHDQAYVQLNPNAFARSASYENGDILIVSGGKLTRLPIGSTGQALTISSGLPAWGNLTLTVTVQVGDVTIDANTTHLDFDPDIFEGSSSPAGEVNLTIKDGGISDAEVATGIDAAKLADGSVSNTEFQYLNGVTSAIQTQLAGKAATSHSHAISDVTSLQTTLDGKSATTHNHDSTYSPVAHTHESPATLMNNATKPYGFTSVSSTTGATVASCDIVLASGVTYDIHATGFGVLNSPSGGSITLGVKIGAQATTWGTEVQVAGADKAAYASSTRTVTGGSTQTIALQCKVSGSSGSITTGHVTVFAVPRNVPAS